MVDREYFSLAVAAAFFGGVFVGSLVGIKTADRSLEQMAQCVEAPDWCRVQDPEMYQAISRPGSEGGE